MAEFRRWARARGLQPSETAYVARTRDRRALRFSASNDPGIEQAYRTHWISPELSERKRDRLAERQSRPPDLLVIAASKPWTCAECAAEFGAGAFLMLEDAGPHCMDCVDLGHLEFLPAGNTALTRRAKKASGLSAVVVRWSRSRKRYQRHGILAEPDAIEQAEAQCLATARCGSGGGCASRSGASWPMSSSSPSWPTRCVRSSRPALPNEPSASRGTRDCAG